MNRGVLLLALVNAGVRFAVLVELIEQIPLELGEGLCGFAVLVDGVHLAIANLAGDFHQTIIVVTISVKMMHDNRLFTTNLTLLWFVIKTEVPIDVVLIVHCFPPQ
jgi:hypothetical protein